MLDSAAQETQIRVDALAFEASVTIVRQQSTLVFWGSLAAAVLLAAFSSFTDNGNWNLSFLALLVAVGVPHAVRMAAWIQVGGRSSSGLLGTVCAELPGWFLAVGTLVVSLGMFMSPSWTLVGAGFGFLAATALYASCYDRRWPGAVERESCSRRRLTSVSRRIKR